MLNVSIHSFYFLLSILLASTVLASPLGTIEARSTQIPAGSLVVSKYAGNGEYSRVQDAVNAVSTTLTKPQVIYIKTGVYNEQVYIPPMAGRLTIYGQTTDRTTYKSNTVTITFGRGLVDTKTNDETATVRAWAANLTVYNINIVNSRGKGCPASALSAMANNQGYYGVSLMGYQDTLLANNGNQIYANSYIDGTCDFIFGQYARAWFQRVDLRVKDSGYITANGRDSATNPSYYVFNRCTISAATGWKPPKGGSYLGRPWRQWARVVFQFTTMSEVINPAGWSIWTPGLPTNNLNYKEYSNTGPGSKGPRALSGTLGTSVRIAEVLGSSFHSWVDKSYL